MASLLKKFETRAIALMRLKDEEITRANNRTMELQGMLRMLEMENQTWQRAAKENEAMIISLNNTIEQMREEALYCSNGCDDAESCCEVVEETGENKNRAVYEAEEDGEGKLVCKNCNYRNSCILFLPCRHLCSCKACEAFLDFCPVCRTGKKASVEAIIS